MITAVINWNSMLSYDYVIIVILSGVRRVMFHVDRYIGKFAMVLAGDSVVHTTNELVRVVASVRCTLYV